MIAAEEAATGIQEWGAFGFGLVLGWFLYFLNRYRKEVSLADLTTVIGAVGGGAILALFPAKTDLFGAYGLGLAAGFFGYFLVLVALVAKSPNFGVDYLIDGRRTMPDGTVGYPSGPDRPMAAGGGGLPSGV
ncbi:MAG: hypothetical protein ACRD0N_05490 [Acidimicrobiales bacterium]